MADLVSQRLAPGGPKRILALDGGGTRGIVTINFLERIEAILRERHGDPKYVLSDYFDLIGGTSVGSMLATMLAMGFEMKEVRETFNTCARKIFRHKTGDGIFWPSFDHRSLIDCLDEIVGKMPLEDSKIKTGLAIVAKRVDSGSPWVVYNHRDGKYWNTHAGDEAEVSKGPRIGNRHYPVAKLIRAATAAPTYFAPEDIQIHELQQPGLFVDGGVSPHNSPALLMFQMAGLQGYRLNWELGPDKLLIVSVGTGKFRVNVKYTGWTRRISGKLAGEALLGIISDCQDQALTQLQWLSEPRRRWSINDEIDDLSGECLGRRTGGPGGALSFVRYDIKLEQKWLSEKLNRNHYSERRLNSMRQLDNVPEMHALNSIASQAAAYQVQPEDFPDIFNRPRVG